MGLPNASPGILFSRKTKRELTPYWRGMTMTTNLLSTIRLLLFAIALASILASTQALSATALLKPKPAQMWTSVPNEAAQRPDMLYATGEGAVPDAKEQPNRAKAYIQAKVYAKMAAIASLAQEVRGTMISYSSIGKNGVADTRIKQEIKGVLDCVQVVSAKKRPEGKDTIVEVTVRAPKPVPPKAPPAPKEAPAPKAPAGPTWLTDLATAVRREGRYTSVVIDATRLRVERSMSPKILRHDGSEVWGTVKTDLDALSEYGIAAYVRSRAEAQANRRCGQCPLVIRAIARGPSITRSDVVISDADAELLLGEDRRSGFLADLRVIIVVD
jgi:hypothetical protein